MIIKEFKSKQTNRCGSFWIDFVNNEYSVKYQDEYECYWDEYKYKNIFELLLDAKRVFNINDFCKFLDGIALEYSKVRG